jgi:hypothetical protein
MAEILPNIRITMSTIRNSFDPTENQPLRMALEYADEGWPVFPVHYPTDNGCSCEKECDHIGKHPMTRHGYKDATTDTTQIEEWWSQYPESNIGIPTGMKTFYVLDIDVADGKLGDQSLLELEKEFGEIPVTLEAISGSGGSHYFFSYDKPLPTRRGLRPGIDFIGEGGYIIVAPSKHKSGGNYQWVNFDQIIYGIIEDVPDWLVDFVLTGNQKEGQPLSATSQNKFNIRNLSSYKGTTGDRNETLFRLGCSMREQYGFDEIKLINVLSGTNQSFEQPLSESEVKGIAAGICNNYKAGIVSQKDSENRIPQFDLETYLLDKYETESNRDPNKQLGYKLNKFSNIQSKLDGIQAGFYIIAAETNIGKTALLTNLFMDLVESNPDITGVYFSMDDHKKDIINKIVAAKTGIAITPMQKMQKDSTNQRKIKAAYDAIIDLYRKKRLMIFDQGNLHHINQISALAQDLKPRRFFFAVDGIFNIDVGDYAYKREENIERANELKRISDVYQIPVISTAEVRKSINKGSVRTLTLDDIMETAKYVYNANVVWLLSGNGENEISLTLNYAKNKLEKFKKTQSLIYQPDFGKVFEDQSPF